MSGWLLVTTGLFGSPEFPETGAHTGTGSAGGFTPFPTAVAGVSGVQHVAAGGFHNLVGTTSGSVFAWGGNQFGQLGNGSHNDAAAPVEITLAANAVQLSAGSRHSLALMGNGSVRAWGDNRSGQLGLSGLGDTAAPTTVPGISVATGISAGGRRSLAQTGAATVVEWGAGDSTPRSITGALALPVLGGEAGANPLGYGLGFQQAIFGYDTQGNVRHLRNEVGAVTDAYTYDAYGNLIERVGSTHNAYLYQGERLDPESGLYHLGVRDFDPRLGRFQQLDHFPGFPGKPASHNRYAYAEGDPVNQHDPSGMYATSIAGAMHLLYQMDDYLATLASIGPSERTLTLDDYLVDPTKAAMGLRPTIVNRERTLTLQGTPQGVLLGSLEQEAGAQSYLSAKVGKGADGDTYFMHKTAARFRQSPVERLVESAWSATRNLWPQLNTGSKYSTDPKYGRNLRQENRWSDVIYHDAILQAGLRSSMAPGMEVQARFTRTLNGRSYVANPQGRAIPALIKLRLADGGVRQWASPYAGTGGDGFTMAQAGALPEWGQNELWKEFSEQWGKDANGFDFLSLASLAHTPGNIVSTAYERWTQFEDAGITNPFTQWALLTGEYSLLLSPVSGAHTLITGQDFYDGSQKNRLWGALELGLAAIPAAKAVRAVGAEARLASATAKGVAHAETQAAIRARVTANIKANQAATSTIGKGLAKMESRAAARIQIGENIAANRAATKTISNGLRTMEARAAARAAESAASTPSKYLRTEALGRKVLKNLEDFDGGVPSAVNRNRVHPQVLKRLDAGVSNLDLMREGYAPIGSDGLPINLHHILGNEPGPMVELLTSTHQKYSRQLHGLIEEGASFRNNSRLNYQYSKFQEKYWKLRAEDFR